MCTKCDVYLCQTGAPSRTQVWFRAIDVGLSYGLSSLLRHPPAWQLLQSTDHLGKWVVNSK
jgi:hypothetical protein